MSQPLSHCAAASLPPAPYQVFGELRDATHGIAIRAATLRQILAYSQQDLQRELGGFLLGRLWQDDPATVEVRHFLPAADTRSRPSSLTFTHNTWAALTRAAEQQFPGELVLGWHHTHPDFGIFLSRHDQFIHRHFFSQPWQIALVVDPRRQQLGFFQWCGSQVVDCGFLVSG